VKSLSIRWRVATALGAIAASGAVANPAGAAPPVAQPPMDLGQTSFLDGEAGQGALLEVIGDGVTADYFTDSNGKRLPGRHELQTGSITFHPAYVSGVQFVGGHLGVESLLPIVVVHSDLVGQSEATMGGVGDITVAPFIQWSDASLFGRPLSVRLALQFVAPTGSYSPHNQINFGQNAWQLSPYLAATWRVTQRWEISSRLTYDWSSRNDSPSPAYGASNIQAGDQMEMNLSASYAVSERWRIGVSGYALRQLDDARIGGAPVSGSRQQAFGLGPGVLWNLGSATAIATAYREFATENRPEGYQLVLRLLQPF